MRILSENIVNLRTAEFICIICCNGFFESIQSESEEFKKKTFNWCLTHFFVSITYTICCFRHSSGNDCAGFIQKLLTKERVRDRVHHMAVRNKTYSNN